MKSNKKLAVIQIRGTVGTHPDVKKTLELLRLKRKHACVVVEDNEIYRGMLQKVKDYVTFGEIDEETFKEMLEKRANVVGKKEVKIDAAKIASEYFNGNVKLNEFELKYQIKPFFRLAPPKGGFERKGIKMPYQKGGVLGNRGESIKELIERML
jgi:large subunit ribosomal protein L30